MFDYYNWWGFIYWYVIVMSHGYGYDTIYDSCTGTRVRQFKKQIKLLVHQWNHELLYITWGSIFINLHKKHHVKSLKLELVTTIKKKTRIHI